MTINESKEFFKKATTQHGGQVLARLNAREYYVVTQIATHGNSFNKIGEALNLTPTRIRQIFHKAIRMVVAMDSRLGVQ